MASSKDYEKILELYSEKVKTSGITIERFCQQNGIVPEHFMRWYKQRGKRVQPQIHEVRLIDTSQYDDRILFSVLITSNIGMSFRETSMTYEQLKNLVKNMEIFVC